MGVSRNNGRGQKGKRQKRKGRVFPKRQPTQMENGLRLGFRSGLEKMNAVVLQNMGVKVRFEEVKIPYTVPETNRKYTPDFVLPNGVIIETKGKLEPKDRAKHLFVKAQHPELDIRFVFQRPHDKIRKGSKTTYAVWCENHGFLWATKTIPAEWVHEAGPKLQPEEVLNDVSSSD